MMINTHLPPCPEASMVSCLQVDVWAAGIWLVALLFGAFPYDNRPNVDDVQGMY